MQREVPLSSDKVLVVDRTLHDIVVPSPSCAINIFAGQTQPSVLQVRTCCCKCRLPLQTQTTVTVTKRLLAVPWVPWTVRMATQHRTLAAQGLPTLDPTAVVCSVPFSHRKREQSSAGLLSCPGSSDSVLSSLLPPSQPTQPTPSCFPADFACVRFA